MQGEARELIKEGVVTAVYPESHEAPPNADSIDVTRTDYKDGSFIQYDRSKHELRIKCVGKIFIDGTKIHLNEDS